MKKILMVVASAALAFGFAAAQEVQEETEGLFRSWDVDQSEYLDIDEFVTGLFDLWDSNDDMGLDEDELLQASNVFMGPDSEVVFSDFDNDANGFVSEEEFSATLAPGVFQSFQLEDDEAEEDVINYNQFNRAFFSLIDRDESASIDANEFAESLGVFDQDMFFDDFDADDDDEIDEAEFGEGL